MSTLKVNNITNVDGSTFIATKDFVKLQSATGSDLGGALIFDNLETSTYRSFRLNFALLPASNVDGYYPNMRLRTGGSSGSDDTNAHYSFGYIYNYPNDNIAYISRADYTYCGLAITVGATGSSEGINGIIDITLNRSGDDFNTGNGGTYAQWQTGLHHEGTGWRGNSGQLSYNNSSTVNHTGFKIYMGTGTSESGGFDNYKYTLYGVK